MKTTLLSLLALLAVSLPVGAQQNILTGEEYPTGYLYASARLSKYATIDGVLYICYSNGEPSTLVRYPAADTRESYTIPASVSCIARGAFQGCRHLRELVLPASLVYIGDNAFDDSSVERFEYTDDQATQAPAVSSPQSREVARYDLSGRRLPAPLPGVNIVEMSDHTSRKQLVK